MSESDIAFIGKMISSFVAIILYLLVWAWSVNHSEDCNRNARWEVLVARMFIGFNIGILVVWFIWSWKH